MSPDTIRTRLSRVLEYHLDAPAEDITDSARIIEDLGADSLDIVELTMAAEEEFGIEITDTDMEDTTTVADFAALIERGLE